MRRLLIRLFAPRRAQLKLAPATVPNYITYGITWKEALKANSSNAASKES